MSRLDPSPLLMPVPGEYRGFSLDRSEGKAIIHLDVTILVKRKR